MTENALYLEFNTFIYGIISITKKITINKIANKNKRNGYLNNVLCI